MLKRRCFIWMTVSAVSACDMLLKRRDVNAEGCGRAKFLISLWSGSRAGSSAREKGVRDYSTSIPLKILPSRPTGHTEKCAVITGGSQANQDVNSALLSYTFFLLIRFLKLSSLINMHFTSDSGSDTRLNSSNCVYLLVHLTVLC